MYCSSDIPRLPGNHEQGKRGSRHQQQLTRPHRYVVKVLETDGTRGDLVGVDAGALLRIGDLVQVLLDRGVVPGLAPAGGEPRGNSPWQRREVSLAEHQAPGSLSCGVLRHNWEMRWRLREGTVRGDAAHLLCQVP